MLSKDCKDNQGCSGILSPCSEVAPREAPIGPPSLKTLPRAVGSPTSSKTPTKAMSPYTEAAPRQASTSLPWFRTLPRAMQSLPLFRTLTTATLVSRLLAQKPGLSSLQEVLPCSGHRLDSDQGYAGVMSARSRVSMSQETCSK